MKREVQPAPGARHPMAGLLLAAALMVPGARSASADSHTIVPITDAPGYQSIVASFSKSSVAADGLGGYFIAWQDHTVSPGIVLQRFDRSVSPRADWPAGGVLLGTPYWSELIGLVPDGVGGVVAWWLREDARTLLGRVRADGSTPAGWPATGVALGSGGPPRYVTRVVPDGSGGQWAVFLYGDFEGAALIHVGLTRILGDGTPDPQWGDGGADLTDHAPRYSTAEMIPDGHGGVLVQWTEVLTGGDEEIRVQRFLTSGARAHGWPAGGVTLFAGNVTTEHWFGPPLMTPDERGGAFVGWTVGDVGTMETEVFVSHVMSDGVIPAGWPAGGLQVSSTDWQEALDALLPDGAGGAFVAWQQGTYDVRLQRVTANGSLAPGSWREGGVSLVEGDATRGAPGLLAPDGEGGVYGVWLETYPPGGFDFNGTFVAQRMTASGGRAENWPAEGLRLPRTPHRPQLMGVASAGLGDLLLVWSEHQLDNTNAEADVYALQIAGLEKPIPGLRAGLHLGPAWPNPTPGAVTTELALGASGRVVAKVVDIGGRTVRVIEDTFLAEGFHNLRWNGLEAAGRPARPGIYFLVVEALERRASVRVALIP